MKCLALELFDSQPGLWGVTKQALGKPKADMFYQELDAPMERLLYSLLHFPLIVQLETE